MEKIKLSRLAARLTPYTPGEQPPPGMAIVKLNTNENPYPPSPHVFEAVIKATEDLRRYPDPDCTELRQLLAAKDNVRPENIFVGNGSDEVLAFLFAALFDSATAAAGEETLPVLFPDITYSFYPVYARLWNIPFRTVPLNEDFTLDPQSLCVPCGGVVFANPNAPTGLALGRDALRVALDYHREAGTIVAVDEAYCPFWGESAVSLQARYPALITVHTFSKVAALAGLRVGYAVGGEPLIAGLNRVKNSFNSYPVDRLAQAGAAAALRDWGYYADTIEKILATRERVFQALLARGWKVLPSSSNFLFASCPGKTGEELLHLFREVGILVRHFAQPRIAAYVRVTIGTDPDMDRFLEAAAGI